MMILYLLVIGLVLLISNKNEYQSDIHARENFKTKNFLVESSILNIKKYARINLHVFFSFLCHW